MSDRTRAGRIACPQHVAVKPIVIRATWRVSPASMAVPSLSMAGSAAQKARSSTQPCQETKESTSPDLSSEEGQESASSLQRRGDASVRSAHSFMLSAGVGATPQA